MQEQRKKSDSNQIEIGLLEQEIAGLKIKLEETRTTAHKDHMDLMKLSDHLKDKIQKLHYRQDDQLENLYSARYKLMQTELEKSNEEKNSLAVRLKKKKEDYRKLKQDYEEIRSTVKETKAI